MVVIILLMLLPANVLFLLFNFQFSALFGSFLAPICYCSTWSLTNSLQASCITSSLVILGHLFLYFCLLKHFHDSVVKFCLVEYLVADLSEIKANDSTVCVNSLLTEDEQIRRHTLTIEMNVQQLSDIIA